MSNIVIGDIPDKGNASRVSVIALLEPLVDAALANRKEWVSMPKPEGEGVDSSQFHSLMRTILTARTADIASRDGHLYLRIKI